MKPAPIIDSSTGGCAVDRGVSLENAGQQSGLQEVRAFAFRDGYPVAGVARADFSTLVWKDGLAFHERWPLRYA
jgi:hypothetical protein